MRQVCKQLEAVKQDNGFNNTLSIDRPAIGRKIERGPGKVIPLAGTASRLGDEAESFSEWQLTVWLLCYFGQPDDVAEPLDQAEARMRADIEQAFEGNEYLITLGGEAIELRIEEFTSFDDDNTDLSGTLATLNIHYRHDVGNPYS